MRCSMGGLQLQFFLLVGPIKLSSICWDLSILPLVRHARQDLSGWMFDPNTPL